MTATMLAARLHEIGQPMRIERVPTPRPTDCTESRGTSRFSRT
jgi:hypothetical protein